MQTHVGVREQVVPVPIDLDAELAAELLEHYLSTADARVAAIDAALADSRSSPTDAPKAEVLRRVVHKLAGSAGTYGFAALTTRAKELEARLMPAQELLPGVPLPAELHDAAAALRTAMVVAFAAARATLASRSAVPVSPVLASDAGAEAGAFSTEPYGGSSEPSLPGQAERDALFPFPEQAERDALFPFPEQAERDALFPLPQHAERDALLPVPEPARAPKSASAQQRPTLSAVRQRLVVAVIGDTVPPGAGELAEAVGASLARAGTHLGCAGLDAAAHGFRDAEAEGLVLGFLGSERHHAGPDVDVPIPCGGGDSQAGLMAHSCDGAILIAGGPASLTEVGHFLREGKPVVALFTSAGIAALLAGRVVGREMVHAADTPDDAVMQMLVELTRTAVRR